MSATTSSIVETMCAQCGSTSFELRFNSLFSNRAVSFPCDACGHVDLDALSDRARNNYFAARALIGRDFAYPVVEAHAQEHVG